MTILIDTPATRANPRRIPFTIKGATSLDEALERARLLCRRDDLTIREVRGDAQ